MWNCTRALLLSAAAFMTNAAADDNAFLNTDVFELEIAANPQIAPDGSRIAYIRRAMDIMTDRAVSNIWIIDADGRNHRPLLTGTGSFGGQTWSPNGDRLAYVTNAEGRGAQIHVMWMDSGRSAALTNLRRGPGNLTWSPDGKWIAFSMFVPREGLVARCKPPAKPEGAEWAPSGNGDRVCAVPRRRGRLPRCRRHAHLRLCRRTAARRVRSRSGEFNHGGRLAWTPDGKSLVFGANRQEDWIFDPMESELWSVDVCQRVAS